MDATGPNGVASASGAILEGHDLRVQVVGHRNCEEKQHEGEADSAPFLQTMPDRSASLVDPLYLPRPQQDEGDE
jgi:hypothetical protein